MVVRSGGGGRIRWEWNVLPAALRGIEPAPNLYHATWNHGIPRGLPFPSILTLHDLIPWKLPGAVPWPRPAILHQALYRRAVSSSASEAARIVVVSEATRADVAALLPGVASRTEVVSNALPPWFQPVGREAGAESRKRFADGGPYWLYLGGFDPRKGIDTLLGAIDEAFPDRSHAPDLVLAGSRNREAERAEALARALGVRVHFPGYIPDAELAAIFAGASLFIYPSRYEGFGIPLLFALASEVPCVVSDGGSLPEVAGDAGILFPAGDVAALARVLRRAAGDSEWLAAHAARGPARASQFRVEAMAERMLRAYERAMEGRARSS